MLQRSNKHTNPTQFPSQIQTHLQMSKLESSFSPSKPKSMRNTILMHLMDNFSRDQKIFMNDSINYSFFYIIILSTKTSTLQSFLNLVTNSHLILSNFFVLKRSLQRSEKNSIAFRGFSALWIFICHSFLNIFNQVSSDCSDNFEKIICVITLLYPQRDIFVAGWEFTKLFKLCYLSFFELRNKSRIFRPKESNIWYLKEFHSEPFKTKACSPSNLMRSSALLKHELMNNSASQHLNPFFIIKYLQLKRWLGERKVSIYPSFLTFSEKII